MGPRDSFGDALRTIRSACSELFRSGARQLEPDRQPGDREIRPTAPTPLRHRARGPAGSQTVATQWSRPPTPPMPDNSTVHEPHALLRTLAAAMVGLEVALCAFDPDDRALLWNRQSDPAAASPLASGHQRAAGAERGP